MRCCSTVLTASVPTCSVWSFAVADCVLANFGVGVGDRGPALQTIIVTDTFGGLAYIAMRRCKVYNNIGQFDAIFFQGTLDVQDVEIESALEGKYNVSANAFNGQQGVDVMYSPDGALTFWSRAEEVWVGSFPLPSESNTAGRVTADDPFIKATKSVCRHFTSLHFKHACGFAHDLISVLALAA